MNSTKLEYMSKPKESSLCDDRVYETFFRTHAKALRNLLFVKFGDMSQAEDLVQEAFVKIWDNCSSVEFKTAKSYLYKIAINLGISKKRHEQVKFKYQELKISTGNFSTNESPEFIMQENEFMEKFKRVIANLPDRQREVFLLNKVEKKTYREIAELSNVSVKAIENV